MSKSITKVSAVVLAVMTLLSSIFVVQADAATGDKVTIAFYYCFDSGGNSIRYQQTTSNNGYTVGSAGEELCRITANGEEAYCIEPGHSLFAGDQLTEGSSSVWNSLGTAKQNAINLALLCGKPGSESSLSGTADEKWAATQLIVWEIVSDCRLTYGSYQCTNTKYIDGITAGGANSGVKTVYNQIVSNMQTIQRIPSFAADSASNAKTYEMSAINGGYSLSLYDGNSVLDKFNFSSAGGVTVARSGNTLTLTAKNPINSAVTLSATRVISGVNTSLIAYGDSGLQDVVTGTSGITVSAYLKVTAKSGSLKLVKTSEDGIVSGIQFTVTGTNYSQNVATNANGEFVLNDLVSGTYTVTEKEYSRYEKQSPKMVKVESGKTALVSFNNTLRKGNLKIIKTSEDGIVEGIEFVITGPNGYKRTAKSNAQGEIILSDFVPGSYMVAENADSRYKGQAPQIVMVEANKTATVTFKNTLRKGGLNIIKTSEDGIVADIEFTITGKNYSRTAKSDANGEILLPDLVPGTYTVTEKVDPRYETQAPKTVVVQADKTAMVSFRNTLRKGNLKIVKTSEDSEIEGIQFVVSSKNYSKTVMTNAKGEMILPDLIPGTYTVTEIADERYEAQEPKTVVIEADKTATVSFKNTLRKGNLKIIKKSEDGIVAGIEFTVKGSSFNQTVKTNANGEMLLENLVPGVYTVTESVDDRYEPQAPKRVKVVADKTATVTFKNSIRKSSLKIFKISEDDIVADIEFTVTGANFKQTLRTNEDGEIALENLVPGTYTITESVDDRYEKQEPQTVTVEADKTATVTFKNTLRKGNLKIIKTSEDGIVADILFVIKGEDYRKTAKSNAKGEIVLPDLIPGTYTVTEKVDPRYEAQAPKTVKVEADKTTTVSFKNTLRKGGLKIIKTSEDGIVADIEFTITGKNYIRTAKSDKNGEIVLADLIPGTYTVTEKVDPRYEAQEPKTVVVKADETATVSFKNTLRKGDLKIVKTSEDGIVADIEFTITGKNYNRTAKSDKNGEIILVDLIPGTYTVTEKVDPRYEAQAPKTVKVEADKIATVEFKNILRKGGLKIIKTSEDGIVADIEFTITGKNYSRTAKSDKNGEIVLTDLIPGTYTVTEKVDPRYEAQEPKTVVVKADETATVSFKNTLRKGDLKIIKTSEDGIVADIEFIITGENYNRIAKSDKNGEIILPDLIPGTYTVTEKVDPRYETQAPKTVKVEADKTVTVTFKNTLKKWLLYIVKRDSETGNVIPYAGTAFQIYAPDGTIVSMNGVDTFTTNSEGCIITPEPLPYGKGYSIAEVKAPYGTVLNREPKIVELTYAGQNKRITTAAAEFNNNRQKVKIDLKKIMGIDERFELGLNDEVLNVTFGLFADEDITAENGNVIPKDGLIEIVSCDENGFAEFSTELPFGSYYVQELTTDEHYILSETKYPVVFEYAGQDIDTVNIKVNDGEPIINEPKYGTVKGLKIDRESEETIEGAVFGLFKNDETVFTEDTAILIAISDENGIFSFENVPYGEYIVHEIKPVDGYIPNENNYPITISEHEEVVEITAVNDRFPEIRTTAMIEGKKEVGATDVFTLEDTIQYKHLFPGKEYVLKGILMDKATNAPFLSDGKELTSEVVFTPEQANGTVMVQFVFDAALITEETDIVVFETLYADGVELAVHADIDDDDQTVTVKIPEIRTHAEADSKKEVTAEEKITITDTVNYKNLTVGKEYTVKGVLMDKSTGKPFMVDDKEITAEVTFTAETADGNIEVVFIFDGLTVKTDTDVVVFETLYHNGIELTAHADIEDEDQTVKIRLPKIRTQASIDGKKEVTANKPVTITDIVSFENLTVGKEYKLVGVLMDKATGKPMTVNGNEITSEVVFTAEKENGEIEVSFTFGGVLITKDIELVFFETLYREGNEIAVHADISDTDQTVIIRPVIIPPPDVPKTGDNTPVSLWIGLGAVALGAVIAFLFVKFRKKDEDDDE